MNINGTFLLSTTTHKPAQSESEQYWHDAYAKFSDLDKKRGENLARDLHSTFRLHHDLDRAQYEVQRVYYNINACSREELEGHHGHALHSGKQCLDLQSQLKEPKVKVHLVVIADLISRTKTQNFDFKMTKAHSGTMDYLERWEDFSANREKCLKTLHNPEEMLRVLNDILDKAPPPQPKKTTSFL